MKKSDLKQPIMFIVSAVVTGAIYMGLLYLCRSVFTLNPYVSISVAYAGAMAFYFTTNKLVVFKNSGGGSVWRELVGFLPLAVVNYILTLVIVGIIRRFTNEEYSGSVVAGIVTTALAYLVFNKFLFKKQEMIQG